MKKAIAILLLIVFALSLAACGNSAAPSSNAGSTAPAAENAPAEASAKEKMTDEFGEYTPLNSDTKSVEFVHVDITLDGSIATEAMRTMKQMLESRSDGKMTLTIHNASTLASSTAECYSLVISGDVDMAGVPIGASLEKDFSVFDVPGVFSDWDVLAGALTEGKLVDGIQETFASKGVQMMFAIPRSYRIMTSNKRIESPADIKGLSLRLPENPIWVAVWNDLGAITTTIPMSEVFLALQQGMADAQENSPDQIVNNNLLEVQKYVILTNHVSDCYGFIINSAKYNSLTVDQRTLLDECIRDTGAWARDNAKLNYEGFLEKLKGQAETTGTEILTPSQELLNAFLKAAENNIDSVRAISDKANSMVDAALEIVNS